MEQNFKARHFTGAIDMILGVVGSLLVGGITWVLVSHEAGVLAMYAIVAGRPHAI